jgi:hypothetical protein
LVKGRLRVYNTQPKQGGVSVTLCVALPFTLKSIILRQKEEELWKLKYFTMQKYINLQKML